MEIKGHSLSKIHKFFIGKGSFSQIFVSEPFFLNVLHRNFHLGEKSEILSSLCVMDFIVLEECDFLISVSRQGTRETSVVLPQSFIWQRMVHPQSVRALLSLFIGFVSSPEPALCK